MPSSESLGQKQRRFARSVALLIQRANALGYEVTLGDAFRDPRSHGAMGVKGVYGEASSAHKQRLAIDLNLFKAGVFLQSTDDHEPLGLWWEAQAPDHVWGGRFNDGNHYSIKHGNIA